MEYTYRHVCESLEQRVKSTMLLVRAPWFISYEATQRMLKRRAHLETERVRMEKACFARLVDVEAREQLV